MITGIYKIISPSNRVYIGQSVNIRNRWSSYRNLFCEDQPKLYNSLKKHGAEKHTFEIIEECLFEDLNVRERYWQDFYEVIGENGLNCVLTATDELPKKVSQEVKDKISKANKGKVVSEETRAKLRASKKGTVAGERNPMFGKHHSLETREKIRKTQIGENSFFYGKKGELHHLFGGTLSESHKEKISLAMQGTKNHFYGKNHTQETKDILRKLQSKPVRQYTKQGVFVKEYESVKQAAIDTGFGQSGISNNVCGLSKSSSGYVWTNKELADLG